MQIQFKVWIHKIKKNYRKTPRTCFKSSALIASIKKKIIFLLFLSIFRSLFDAYFSFHICFNKKCKKKKNEEKGRKTAAPVRSAQVGWRNVSHASIGRIIQVTTNTSVLWSFSEWIKI